MNIANKKLAGSILMTSLLLLSACAAQRGENETSGMIIGGLIGGVLGHEVGSGHGRTAATILGTMIGTTIGGNVGRSMDESDRIKVSRSLETVRTGVETSWQNPDTGYHYLVVPTKTIETNSGPCREYTVDASFEGETRKIYGTACRQSDGSWHVQN